jgi:hypothetical protein
MGHPVAGCGRFTLPRLLSSANTCGLTPARLAATTSSSNVLPACMHVSGSTAAHRGACISTEHTRGNESWLPSLCLVLAVILLP